MVRKQIQCVNFATTCCSYDVMPWRVGSHFFVVKVVVMIAVASSSVQAAVTNSPKEETNSRKSQQKKNIRTVYCAYLAVT